MHRFLIQTVAKHIRHDFAFHLIEAIEYQNWYQNEIAYDFKLAETSDGEPDDIPVGSLEFVMRFIEQHHGIAGDHLHPINVPVALQAPKWAGRSIQTGKPSNVEMTYPLFVKSADRYKDIAGIIHDKMMLPDGVYQFSEIVEFTSEWRAFVFRGELRGIHYYSVDFTEFPDIVHVKQMIDAYHDAPAAYTLDIGKTEKGWFVVEVHPFVSCGLYGFRDNRVLAQMMISGFRWMVEKGRGEVGEYY